MATGSLLALIDDIASVLDDVSLLTKVAAKKTAGVLGDDLALNAQQVSGVAAERELPVVWAVAKGSLVNKAILVPVALLTSAYAPWAVIPLLMIGGAFLCYEGCEKLAHRFFHRSHDDEERQLERARTLVAQAGDPLALEKDKVRGAVRTDFVLSAEIIAITLATVANSPFLTQLLVLTGISLLMTVGVYGLVAGIVKLDDAGTRLAAVAGQGTWQRLNRAVGRGILRIAPWLMKALSVAGTAAMFLVGGGILTHGIPALHHAAEAAAHRVETIPGIGVLLAACMPLLFNLVVGLIAGTCVWLVVIGARRLFAARKLNANE